MADEQEKNRKVQVRIPTEVAKIMQQWGGHGVKLAAARGTLPMSGPHLVTVLFVFCHGKDEELKQEALRTLRELAPGILVSALSQEDVIPEILDLVARVRYRDPEVMEPLLTNRRFPHQTLLFLAARVSGKVLDIIANNEEAMRKSPALKTLIWNNPHADQALRTRLAPVPEEKAAPQQTQVAEPLAAGVPAADLPDAAADDVFEQDVSTDDFEDLEKLSKYQRLIDMPVAEKIKVALTGDKEWRTLLLREANKLVTTAVLKNPRITENEVIAVAKNRASSDDMIRTILLNKDWTKLYEIKKALVFHPRTPLQKAMRLMGFLSEKDLKEISRSKNVAQAIVSSARRMLQTKNTNR